MASHGPFAFLGLNTQDMSGGGDRIAMQIQQGVMGQVNQAGLLAPPPPPPPMLDPLRNNQPLQFDSNKGKPPMPIIGPVLPASAESRSTEEGNGKQEPPVIYVDDYPADEFNQSTPVDYDGRRQNSGANNMNSNMQGQMMGPNMMGPWMGPMGGDPNMMMMGPMGYNQYGYMGGMGPGMMDGPMQKEIITLKSCTMYPPPPNAPPNSCRERPPGCRTVFVGGLPETMTEEMLQEVFENCGNIISIRHSKKNFAHIRFDSEHCIDKAMYISGYRIKIGNQDDKPNTGRIHVDYAEARDDLFEWECQQRILAREQRHRQKMEESQFRPLTPPLVIEYSDHEAANLLEDLKGDDTFSKGTQILVAWLDRGNCSRRNANSFYSLIQSTNSHIRRLMNEKVQYDEEYEQMKAVFRLRLEGLLHQFEQIEAIFLAASKQKNWDNFSKAQRKNLDVWKRQVQEVKAQQQADYLKDREEAEMEMSDEEADSDEPSAAKKRKHEESNMANVMLKEDNNVLKCQLEAYKNEVDLLKQDNINAIDDKDKQIKALQQALQGMQQQLISSKQQMKVHQQELIKLQTSETENGSAAAEEGGDVDGEKSESTPTKTLSRVLQPSTEQSLNEKEARLIGLISTFLHVHPFGASVDYIWSYLQQLQLTIRTSEIEDLLERLPSVFRQDIMGVGARIEKRWKFLGFDVTGTTPTIVLSL